MKALALVLLLASGLAAAAPRTECPANLKVGFPDIPLGPMLRGVGAQFEEQPGHLVVATKLALEELGCKYTPVRLPFRRLLSDLGTDKLDVAVGLTTSKERQQSFVYPLDSRGEPEAALAVGQAAVVGLVRATDASQMDARVAERRLADMRFGAVRGSAMEDVAKSLSSAVTDVVSIEKGLTMLRYDRVDVVVLPKGMVRPEDLSVAPSLVELAQPLAVHRYYAPSSPRFARLHKPFLTQFWRSICKQIRTQTGEVGGCMPNQLGGAPKVDRTARSS